MSFWPEESLSGETEQKCPNCGSKELISDPTIGLVCTQCSTVLDTDNIVNSSEFTKQADGSSKLNGQIVGEFASAFNGISKVTGLYLPTPNQSRAQTLSKSKSYMFSLCHDLRLSSQAESLVDGASRIFSMLQQRGFLKGRSANNVSSASLFINCRLKKVPRTLNDFSEVTRVNSFDLGKVFTDIRKLLQLQLPPLDFHALLGRYASELDFGSKEKKVLETAKLVAKLFKKDFISAGRRPEGICAGSLLVAARIHGFSRDVNEVIEIVKISKVTVNKRLAELSNTASSRLNAKELLTVELPSELPPILQQQEELRLIEDGKLSRKAVNEGTTKKNKKLNEFYVGLKSELEDILKKAENITEKEIESKQQEDDDLILEDDFVDFDLDLSKGKEKTDAKSAVIRYERYQSDEKGSDVESEDEDIRDALLNEEQVKKKTALWMATNKDYLEKQKLKEQNTPLSGRKRRKQSLEMPTADDLDSQDLEFSSLSSAAAHKVFKMQERDSHKISDKIDYESWQKLFDVKVPNLS